MNSSSFGPPLAVARDAPIVFFDRDGTLNEDAGYTHRIEDWRWIPGAIDAIVRLNRMGYRTIVVSNQAGVARGLYSLDDVYRLHRFVDQELRRHGGCIDAFYVCPHHPEHGDRLVCDCRKPAPGMLHAALSATGAPAGSCWMIGDADSDMLSAVAAGVRALQIVSGDRRQASVVRPWATVDSVAHAPRVILSLQSRLASE